MYTSLTFSASFVLKKLSWENLSTLEKLIVGGGVLEGCVHFKNVSYGRVVNKRVGCDLRKKDYRGV